MESGCLDVPVSRPELLAPAGGMEQLEYALHFGADAVYVGGERFGLRVRANNFTPQGLAQAADKTHAAKKRIFVTMNALMHEDDLAPLREYLVMLEQLEIDAVIVSDLATLRLAREVAPSLDIHVSTQASCTNALAARTWHELGAKRVVLARELSLDEIRRVRDQVPDALELEVFVHGAMCMAYSGRCLISNYLTGRDANRGHCTQPCRWSYALEEETRPNEFFPVEEEKHGSFIMSSKDLMMLDHVRELEAAGINSMKIEGRVKGAYYVATVVNAYRKVLDGADAADYLPELDTVSHRPYHTGFFFGQAAQAPAGPEYEQTHEWAATVEDCCPCEDDAKSWFVTAKQRNRFFEGDVLEVLSPRGPVQEIIVRNLKQDNGFPCKVANIAYESYVFKSNRALCYGDILRKVQAR